MHSTQIDNIFQLFQLTITDVGLQHSPALFPNKTPQFQNPSRNANSNEIIEDIGADSSYETIVRMLTCSYCYPSNVRIKLLLIF